VLLNVVGPVVLLVLTGYLLGRYRPVEVSSLAPVSMYLFAPALVFQSLTHSPLTAGYAPRLLAACALHLLAMLGLGLAASQALGLHGPRRAAFLLPTFHYNAGNYGLPVALFAFGPPGFQAATLIFVVNATVANFTAGVTAAWGSRGGLRRAVSDMLRLPLSYAVVAAVGVLVTGWKVPQWLERTVDILASGAVPLLVVTLGIQLAQGRGVQPSVGLLTAGVLRLVASPAVAAGVAGLVGLEGTSRDVFVLVAGMPAAVNTFLFASEFGCEPGFVASAVFTTTLASFVTVSALLYLLL
jgi:predicted permease